MHSTDSFSKHYTQHIDEIYRYVFFAVGQQKATAEDLTSAIFLKAFQHKKRFDPQKASFRTFIFHVARNTVIDHYRTSRPTEELKEESAIVVEESDTVDAAFLWQQIQKELNQAAYEILVLRYKNDLPIIEIATLMEITTDAVKSSLKRSKQQLRKKLPLSL